MLPLPGSSGPGSDGNESGTLYSLKLRHYWNLTIRLFSVIYRTIVGGEGSYLSAEMQSVYSTSPTDRAENKIKDIFPLANFCFTQMLMNTMCEKDLQELLPAPTKKIP